MIDGVNTDTAVNKRFLLAAQIELVSQVVCLQPGVDVFKRAGIKNH